MLLDEKGISITARSLLEMSSKTGDVAYTDVVATFERYRRDDLPDDRDGGCEQLRIHVSRLMLYASAVKPAENVEEASDIDNRGALFRGPHALVARPAQQALRLIMRGHGKREGAGDDKPVNSGAVGRTPRGCHVGGKGGSPSHSYQALKPNNRSLRVRLAATACLNREALRLNDRCMLARTGWKPNG